MARLTDQAILDRLASGVSIDVLAAELDVTPRRASTMIANASKRLAALDHDDATKLRIELANLELIRRSLTPAMLRGDVAAARVLERVTRTRLQAENLLPDARPDGPARPAPERSASGDMLAQLRSERAARQEGSTR